MKTREMKSHHFDSERWNEFKLRDDDIVVATAYKSGTTWMQNIVLQLTYQGRDIPDGVTEMCSWLDLRIPPMEVLNPIMESNPDRRQIKTHLRLDALDYKPQLKYIYIARDGRDAFMSIFNHYNKGSDFLYEMLNTPGFVGDPMPDWRGDVDINKLFDDWISKGWPCIEGETDGYPWWSLFDNLNSWWKYRHLDNIEMFHFNDLKKDLPGQIRRVAAFLEIPIQEEHFDTVVSRCTFEHMKSNADTSGIVPLRGKILEGGGKNFIYKGTNNRWKGVLDEELLAKYDKLVKSKLSPEAAAWLEQGGDSGIDPKKV